MKIKNSIRLFMVVVVGLLLGVTLPAASSVGQKEKDRVRNEEYAKAEQIKAAEETKELKKERAAELAAMKKAHRERNAPGVRPSIEITNDVPEIFEVSFSEYEMSFFRTSRNKIGYNYTLRRLSGSMIHPKSPRPFKNYREGIGGAGEVIQVKAPKQHPLHFKEMKLKLHGNGSREERRMRLKRFRPLRMEYRDVIFETRLEADKWVLHIKLK